MCSALSSCWCGARSRQASAPRACSQSQVASEYRNGGHLQEGSTPLHHAAAKGHLAVVQLLLSSGADIMAETSVTFSPTVGKQLGRTADVRIPSLLAHAPSWPASGFFLACEHTLSTCNWAQPAYGVVAAAWRVCC